MFVYIENIIMGEHCEHGTGKKNKTQDTESDMKISFRCFFDRTRCVREIRMADWEKTIFWAFASFTASVELKRLNKILHKNWIKKKVKKKVKQITQS